MWHIINRGWIKYGLKLECNISAKRNEIYDQVKFNIQTWLYSFAKPTCHSEQEYQVSKKLLYEYINSQYVVNNLGKNFSKLTCNFIWGYVEPHENHFCFFNRTDIRHFDEYSNSAHEGTNNGLKNSTDID